MECSGIQNNSSEWDYMLLETKNYQLDHINGNIRNVFKSSLDSFISQYNNIDNQEHLLAVNWSEGAPYTQGQIDQAREAAHKAKEEANEHIANSWQALGNYHAGDVVRESIEAWNALRASERLDRAACHMENSNIDYDNERR
ncbi:MAG: hypothetical protein WCG10_03180 [Chlamydiota bacterium]